MRLGVEEKSGHQEQWVGNHELASFRLLLSSRCFSDHTEMDSFYSEHSKSNGRDQNRSFCNTMVGFVCLGEDANSSDVVLIRIKPNDDCHTTLPSRES